MYTLYYATGSCSMAVHAMLIECQQAYKLVNVNLQAGEGQKADFLKINPMGQVPVLVEDSGAVRREGAAILQLLAERHNSPLLPKSGEERAKALQWLAFANATLHPAYSRLFFVNRVAPEGDVKQQLLAEAFKIINRAWQNVEEQLSQTPYLAGSQPTLADILVTVIANWSARFSENIHLGTKTKQLLCTISQRPSLQKAMQIEDITYKVAA